MSGMVSNEMGIISTKIWKIMQCKKIDIFSQTSPFPFTDAKVLWLRFLKAVYRVIVAALFRTAGMDFALLTEKIMVLMILEPSPTPIVITINKNNAVCLNKSKDKINSFLH